MICSDNYQASKPFDTLVDNIKHEFTFLQKNGTYGNSEAILSLLTNYINDNKDWNEYAFFCPFKYSRNLVARTDQFELMVICWTKGQVSPIHNHEGQRCWMACVQGALKETQYVYQDTKGTKGNGPLEQQGDTIIRQGTVGYIDDDIGLHVIQSDAETSVSIHLYSKPICECNIYCKATGIATRRKMGYFSEFKEKCPSYLANSCSGAPTQVAAGSGATSPLITTHMGMGNSQMIS
eukprot:gene13871-16361_t